MKMVNKFKKMTKQNNPRQKGQPHTHIKTVAIASTWWYKHLETVRFSCS